MGFWGGDMWGFGGGKWGRTGGPIRVPLGLCLVVPNAAPPPPQVGAVLEELGPSMGQPLARGHQGVAVALMGACLQYKELQQGALRCLFQVSHAPSLLKPRLLLKAQAPPESPRFLSLPAGVPLLGAPPAAPLLRGGFVGPAAPGRGGATGEKRLLSPLSCIFCPKNGVISLNWFLFPLLWCIAVTPLPPLSSQPALGAVTPSGSHLLQLLLHFRDPSAVLGGLRALSDAHLHSLALSPPGSHVWDSIMSSPSVPPRARRRLVRRLKVRPDFGVKSPVFRCCCNA